MSVVRPDIADTLRTFRGHALWYLGMVSCAYERFRVPGRAGQTWRRLPSLVRGYHRGDVGARWTLADKCGGGRTRDDIRLTRGTLPRGALLMWMATGRPGSEWVRQGAAQHEAVGVRIIS